MQECNFLYRNSTLVNKLQHEKTIILQLAEYWFSWIIQCGCLDLLMLIFTTLVTALVLLLERIKYLTWIGNLVNNSQPKHFLQFWSLTFYWGYFLSKTHQALYSPCIFLDSWLWRAWKKEEKHCTVLKLQYKELYCMLRFVQHLHSNNRLWKTG